MTNTPPPYPTPEQPDGQQPPQQQYPQQPAPQQPAPQQPYQQQQPAPYQQQPAQQPYQQQPYQQANGQPPQQPPYAGAAPYAPPPSPRKSRTTRVLVTVGAVVVGVVVAALVRQGITAAMTPSTDDQVKKAVSQLQDEYDFPRQIDSVTTLTGVKADGSAILYEYTISKTVDPATLDASALNKSVTTQACGTSSTRKILDDDVSMKYHYVFDGSAKTLDLTITKSDC